LDDRVLWRIACRGPATTESAEMPPAGFGEAAGDNHHEVYWFGGSRQGSGNDQGGISFVSIPQKWRRRATGRFTCFRYAMLRWARPDFRFAIPPVFSCHLALGGTGQIRLRPVVRTTRRRQANHGWPLPFSSSKRSPRSPTKTTREHSLSAMPSRRRRLPHRQR